MTNFRLQKASLLAALVILAALLAPTGAAAGGGVVRGETLAAPGTHASSAPDHQNHSGSSSSPAATPTSNRSSTPAPGLLFDGSSIGDFGVESAPNAITEVPDPTGNPESVFKMTVRNSDVYPLTPTENPRAQALSPAIIEPGDEFWLSTKFLIPTGTPYVSGWMSLVSIYGPPFEGSSPWQIGVYEHEFRWMREDGRSIPWHTPLVEGSWQTVVLHERFGTNGFVEMWWNGKRIEFFEPGANDANPDHEAPTEHLEMATMDHSNDAGPNSAKIMQYREAGMFGTASIFFGDLKLGSTRASVES